MITFRKHYFLLALILLIIEIMIALYVHDNIIRPYIGDFLVVILIYCFIRSFFNLSILTAALATLLFAYLVEFLQAIDIISKLGLQHSKLVTVIIGNSFEWSDILAYTLGIAIVLLIEKNRGRIKRTALSLI